MRSAAQLSKTPAEWADAQAIKRRRILAELLTTLATMRARGEPAVRWIDEGRGMLTPEEWDEYQRGRARGRARPRSSARGE